MVFSNTSTEDGLVQEIDRICGSTNVNYTLKAKAARLNSALDRFFTIALKYDKQWHFDDANQTNLPDAYRDIFSGQADYTFASELLTVKQVFLKNADGSFDELELDLTSDVWNAESGVPDKFRLVGRSILFNKIPNYDRLDGFHVIFGRNASKFTDADTTKEPGIPSVFHPYLCRHSSLPFLIKNRLPDKEDIKKQIGSVEPRDPYYGGDELNIANYISNMNQVRKPRLRTVQEDNR